MSKSVILNIKFPGEVIQYNGPLIYGTANEVYNLPEEQELLDNSIKKINQWNKERDELIKLKHGGNHLLKEQKAKNVYSYKIIKLKNV